MSGYNINPEALKEFGRLVKEERKNRKDKYGREMSQREFAKVVDVSNSTISRIENGTINSAIDLQVFLAIAETLNLTENQIITLYRLATYKYKNMKDSIEVDIKESQEAYVKKLDVELNLLRTLSNEINSMIEVKEEIQKVNKK